MTYIKYNFKTYFVSYTPTRPVNLIQIQYGDATWDILPDMHCNTIYPMLSFSSEKKDFFSVTGIK